MPFPLAHPAAVLPFRNRFPFYLNFVALLIGSMTPDLSYCVAKYDLDVLAHSLRGCLIFSVPVGWTLALIFSAIHEPLIGLLPAPHRSVLLDACRARPQAWFAVLLSVWIGSTTHVLWDSFTHDTGWFVERSDFLQATLLSWNGHVFRVYRLLWHISTWVALLLLYRAYAKTLKQSAPAPVALSSDEKQRYALWVSLLLLPLVAALPISVLCKKEELSSVAGLTQFLRFSSGAYLVMLSILLVALGAAVKLRDR